MKLDMKFSILQSIVAILSALGDNCFGKDKPVFLFLLLLYEKQFENIHVLKSDWCFYLAFCPGLSGVLALPDGPAPRGAEGDPIGARRPI